MSAGEAAAARSDGRGGRVILVLGTWWLAVGAKGAKQGRERRAAKKGM